MTDREKIDDGGPAFAAGAANESTGWTQEGMSLRDWFAGQAVQAAITGHFSHYGHENYWAPKDIADYAYEVADAMIARKGGAQ
jgi:hypothetical protein